MAQVNEGCQPLGKGLNNELPVVRIPDTPYVEQPAKVLADPTDGAILDPDILYDLVRQGTPSLLVYQWRQTARGWLTFKHAYTLDVQAALQHGRPFYTPEAWLYVPGHLFKEHKQRRRRRKWYAAAAALAALAAGSPDGRLIVAGGAA